MRYKTYFAERLLCKISPELSFGSVTPTALSMGSPCSVPPQVKRCFLTTGRRSASSKTTVCLNPNSKIYA
jgi:hypothetical protein